MPAVQTCYFHNLLTHYLVFQALSQEKFKTVKKIYHYPQYRNKPPKAKGTKLKGKSKPKLK